MTVASLQQDILLLAFFLLVGFAIREIIKPFQKFYLPASVIGGIIALVCGQQVLGLVTLPQSFSQISGTLINLVLTALVFGITINKDRVKGYFDFTLIMLMAYGFQLAVGTIIGIGLSKIWTDLPHAWGTMGVFAFWGGHGNSAAAGTLFKELGVADNMGFGMILATIGLLSAIGIGMIMVNWGVRKGYANYLVDQEIKGSRAHLGGVLPEDEQKSIGTGKVPEVGINNLALQFILLAFCLLVGTKLVDLISVPVPALSKIPGMARGMIGAAIVWPIMLKTGLSEYADKKTCSTISGFALELIVISAIATLRLDIVTSFFLPILILSIVLIIGLLWICFYIVPRVCKIDWFEKMLLNFGQHTGTAATGLALVRCVDPRFKSSAPESTGVGSALLVPITGSMPALIPLLAMQSQSMVIAVGVIMFVLAIILARIFLWHDSLIK